MRRHDPPLRQAGFTLMELVAVLVLVGVLAVTVAPRMDGALSLRTTAWRDQVLAALRQAGALAQGHRRLVCVNVASGAVTLTLSSANPATSCTAAVPGPDGNAAWARDANAPATAVSPAGTLYFQPNGRVTADGAGTSVVDRSISITGETAISLTAETGHAR
jgi:prepilin-type N-terminal cleavage/methylation domain-containing protein